MTWVTTNHPSAEYMVELIYTWIYENIAPEI